MIRMKTWVYQIQRQVDKLGEESASWYVGWLDPDGKRCSKSFGPGKVGQRAAEKFKLKTHIELIEGRYQSPKKKSWAEFRKEFETKIADGMLAQTRRLVLDGLENFERLIKPQIVASIKTQTIDAYRAKRRTERGKKRGELISPASVNKELRTLKAILRKAHKWGYLPSVPDFQFEREPQRLPTFVTPEHFAKIYEACKIAKLPTGREGWASDWWRGLLVMAYMTGWRISELLALLREDVDLEAGTALTRAEHNKGRRDARVNLHPVVIEHLRRLAGFDSKVFPWNGNRRFLYDEFAKIQETAGVKLPCAGSHKHTKFCYVYGFHDLRRSFATMNADRLTGDALQTLMRHKAYATTQRYINMTRQTDEAVAKLHVPEVLKKGLA
jgi:integrase